MVLLMLALAYVILMPILLWGITFAHKKLVVEKAMMKKGPRSKVQKIPDLIWPKWKERLSFAFKDTRPLAMNKKEFGIKRNIFFIVLWILGLLFVLVGALLNNSIIIILGYVTFIFFAVFGINSPKEILEARKNVLTRMFDIAKARLGQSAEYASNPAAVIKVMEWRDLIKPMKVEFQVPTTFDMSGEENFQNLFNQVFGNETSFVAFDDPEAGTPGWDYDKGKVVLKAVPPLPQIAPWEEHYINDPAIAWSFFPIALGVENGVEITNPKTGEIEHVLGFDLSGDQTKLASKMGVKIGREITVSPQVLIGGSTGGGKSMSVKTLVKRIINGNVLHERSENEKSF